MAASARPGVEETPAAAGASRRLAGEELPQVPEISVVIPTHNRRERLRSCLDSLAGQTLEPSRFEVVVAVDGSTDGTAEMLHELETPFALRVVVQPQSGQAAARNTGVAAASAQFVLLLDDD